MVEGARLESVYTGNCIKGSNPLVSAGTLTRAVFCSIGFFVTSYWHGLHSFFLTHLRVGVLSNRDHILQTRKSKDSG